MSSSALRRLGYCEKALELKKDIEENFLLLGEYLYNIKEHQMYTPQWSSFDEYIDELKMSTSNVNRLIQIHKTFVLDYGFSSQEIITAGGSSSLGDILPVITSRKTAEKWMTLSGTLTRKDLRNELIEAKTGVLQTSCGHKNTYTVEICRDCGERKQIV